MISPSEALKNLEKHVDILGKARNDYLMLEGEKKHFEAKLIQTAQGKSHAEREVNAQASIEWREFHKKLARALSIMEFQKLKYQILEKTWLTAYLDAKMDHQLIRKQD